MNRLDQPAGRSAINTRLEKAEARTDQAETRADQAKTRAESAETRTEQAENRTELAKTRTEQAETRTGQAESRAEQAESRAEQAESRAEQAETSQESCVHHEMDSLQGIPPGPLAIAPVTGTAGRGRLLERLTARQREILQFIAQGENTKQIADLLKISPKTVEYHRMKLMTSLNVHDIPGLVRFAMRVGLIPLEGSPTDILGISSPFFRGDQHRGVDRSVS